MHAFNVITSLALLISTVHAAIYVTNPVASSTCHGGQSCDVAWTDDGQSPLLNAIGECTVGLYYGEMILAQSLTSVDVSSTSSLSFTPNPSAGPNGAYYLVFTSNGIAYQGWSASFTLDGMTGTGGGSGAGNSTSAGSSTGAGISTLSGSSTASAPVSSISGTVTTTLTTHTSSGLNTITTPSSSGSHSSTGTSATSSSTQSSAAQRAGRSTSLAGSLVLALAGALVF